jgi:RHS repeat-associated protein
MPTTASSQPSVSAAALFLLVVSFLIAPLGALVANVTAGPPTGGTLPPQVLVAPDPLSDAVAATAAEFRVDESGAATYSVPLYAVPGTAGVAPQVSLSYSSQGGYGPIGKGWSLSGLSSISRCRATREAGDFLGAATPDGNPAPINFTGSDRFCLDGQRLIPAATTCAAASGLTAIALSTEIDSFQRVCAYSSSNGPAFFTVQRKDGSISWYGDRDNQLSANRPDGYFETNSSLNPAAALTWAQTRFQDSTGNFIDYLYTENPAGVGTGEHLISEIRYTGRIALPGQATGASAPYAKLVFNYAARPAAQWSKGYASGGTLTQTRRLDSITSCATIACEVAQQTRHYLLTYAISSSGSGQDTLIGLQECRDSTGAVCSAPTAFAWSQGKHEFASTERPAELQVNIGNFKGFKLGDVNGDGRPDFVYLRTGSGQCGTTEHMVVALGSMNGAGTPGFTNGQVVCTPVNIRDRGEGAWHLLDYNGDGRDDLFLSTATNQGWRVYLSNGQGFDPAQNPIAGLSPQIPSYDGKLDQVQLADLNGDGLTDVVYPRAGALRARIMERFSGGFGWGAERVVAIDDASLGPIASDCDSGGSTEVQCSRTIGGAPTPKTGFAQMADFNGDAASDLMIQVTDQIIRRQYGTPECGQIPVRTEPVEIASTASAVLFPYQQEESQEDGLHTASALGDSCTQVTIRRNLHAFSVQSLAPTALLLRNYGKLAGADPEELSLADANGDGLTDIFVRATASANWQYAINRGNGFGTSEQIPLLDFLRHVRFVDVNGDGRADVLHPFNGGNYKAYNVKYALPGGGYGAEGWLPGVPGRHANAFLCQYSGCDHDRFVPIFADFDGDGNTDFMSIKMDDNPDLYVSRASSRYMPREVITQITNGLGAQTDVTYAPLTNKELYRRGSGSRNTTNWGRGSPVMDALSASYAVARVSSTSPQAGAAEAKATVHYRYAGARVQAGGRGFLGFDTIDTIDVNQAGGHVVTTTRYSQNFPFVGMPLQTTKKAVAGQAYLVPTCLNGVMTNACFSTPGQAHTNLGGSWFSDSVQSWEVAGSLAAQTPLHVRTQGTEESLRDPFTGALTSKVGTAFSYGSYGNVTQTVVDTYTGAALTATVITANTYSDDVGKWRLGRLTASTITHRRPGQADVVRTTGFSYQMGGAATGLLNEERVQPGGPADQALSTAYLLDDYGNRVQSTTCAAPATACSPAGFQFNPSAATAIKRYSRVEFDARGRFPVATVEPFWSEAGGQEVVTTRVLGRNVFGDAVDAVDVNNVRSLAVKGALGRDYYAWAQTSPDASPGSGGVKSLTTYRWCTQVPCPAGAKFRQQVATQAAPRQWVYFDALGRPVMKAAETFNLGVIDQDVSAACTDYDATGKPKRVSNPFFLPGTAGADGPGNVQGVCASPARLWTTTTYDVLGRPVHVLAPDGSQVSNSYAGLTTTATDPRGNATQQTRNGKGELTKVIDASGLATYYNYFAAGELGSVQRDAGRGVVANYFAYDALGRKIRQQDPDSGLSQFQYNASGELIVQLDAAGQRIENAYDARGRVWRRTAKTSAGVVETQSTYTFDTAVNGIGQLSSETITGTYADWTGQTALALNFSRSGSFDSLGRASSSTTTIDGVAYPGSAGYDALGRPWKGQDASGRWIKTQYDARGAAVAMCESNAADSNPTCPNDASTYQRTLATDAWGNVTRERRGNSAALEVRRTYHAQNGRVAEICGGTSAGCNLIKENYGWDLAGNLSTHQKENRYVEGFTYDSLNRLQQAKVLVQNGVTANLITQQYQYDQLGNICNRQTYGWSSRDYNYAGRAGCGLGGANSVRGSGGTGVASPHQTTALVDGTTLNQYYDANGNLIQRNGPAPGNDLLARYNAANQAFDMSNDLGARVRFWYGPNGQRYKQEAGTKKTLYLGNVEVEIIGASITFRRVIAGTALQTIAGATTATRYLFHDQLGSVVRIASATGALVDSMDFLAFGARRNVDTQAANDPSPPTLTPRGFTGHEMLDSLNLIHMNGRIYDQYLGKFLQPDPVIQAPDNSQSWNAYTYVFNNPLAYTDPSGNISLRQVLGIAIIVIAAVTQQYWAISAATKFWGTVAVGALAGGVSTGTWQGAVWGAFSAAAFYGVGEAFAGVAGEAGTGVYGSGLSGGAYGAKVLAHGITGGVMSTLQGGKFGHGFASAGVTQALGPGIDRVPGGPGARIAASAVLGGTTSVITGGKFGNGAMTAAFSRAFNDEWTHNSSEKPAGPHDYIGEETICTYSQPTCTVSDFQQNWALKFSAPGQINDAGNGVRNDLPLYGVGGPGVWPVVHEVEIYNSPPGFSAPFMRTANITLPGHTLDGRVDRYYFARQKGISVVTRGMGGPFEGAPMNYVNNLAGPALFIKLNSSMRTAIKNAGDR